MIILGINSYHADSSACLLVNGKLVGAISEERLGKRVKHDSSFPINAIKFLLNSNKIGAEDIDYISIGQDKSKNILEKSIYGLKNIKRGIVTFGKKNNTKVLLIFKLQVKKKNKNPRVRVISSNIIKNY